MRARPMLLNLAILREPYNWATVLLMTAFALVLFSFLTRQTSTTPETEN